VIRLSSRTALAGIASLGHGVPGSGAISDLGAIPPGVGGTRTYQVWYRNAVAFCTPSTSNTTNAVELI